ncbi:MAG TPA: hypothetical protein VFN24_05735 [Microbacterium sp.]|nr:hypothetical protein [Microbacterium sp.]
MGTIDSWHLVGLLCAIVTIVLIAWALVTTLRATDIMLSEKIIWSVMLVVFPPIGLIVWALVWFTRRRVRRAR